MSKPLVIELQSFPPIDFFIKGMRAKSVQLEAQENYRKGSYRNRYHIAGPNGLQRLSIPLAGGKHQQQQITDVKIAYDTNWQQQHWRSINAAYGRAPFFIHYEDEIKALFEDKVELLWDWNLKVLALCLELVDIEWEVQETEDFELDLGENSEDFRNRILPKNASEAQVNEIVYQQVFQEKHGFLPNLSILDLIFCQGPNAALLLHKDALKNKV